MKKPKVITVQAAVNQYALESNGADVEYDVDTTLEAKYRGRYYCTRDYMRDCESTVRLTYARVLVNGECVWDYFAR